MTLLAQLPPGNRDRDGRVKRIPRANTRGIPPLFLVGAVPLAPTRPKIVPAAGRWTVRARAPGGRWLVLDGSTDRSEAEALFCRERTVRASSAGRGGEVGLFDPAGTIVGAVQFWEGDHGKNLGRGADRHAQGHPAEGQGPRRCAEGNGRPALQAHLEAWTNQHIQNALSTPFYGLAFQLRLLLRFYEQEERVDDMRNLWARFRRMYPACYTPLLADQQTSSDWQAVLNYATAPASATRRPAPLTKSI